MRGGDGKVCAMLDLAPAAADDRADSLRRDQWVRFAFPILLFVALILAGVVAWRADSLTFDSVVFVRNALRLSEVSWWCAHPSAPSTNPRDWLLNHLPVLRELATEPQHPGFAMVILGVHNLVAPWLKEGDSNPWAFVVRIVSVAGYGLLVLSVYLLGKQLFGRVEGLVGSALVAFSPPVLRIAADGLSDTLGCALLVFSGFFYCRLLERGRARDAVAGSLAAGIGYLIRPEALQLHLAVLAFLALRFLIGIAWLRRKTLRLLVITVIPAALLVVPYVYIKGSPLTKKAYLVDLATAQGAPTAANDAASPTQGAAVQEPIPTPTAAPAVRRPKSEPVWVSSVAKFQLDARSYAVGMYKLMMNWLRLTGFMFLPLILVGLGRHSLALGSRSGGRLIMGAALANLLGLPFALYCLCNYLDIRHVLPLFTLTTVGAWPGIIFIGGLLRRGISEGFRIMSRPFVWPISLEPVCAAVCVLMLASLAILGLNQRVDGHTEAFRIAGEWMKSHVPKETPIVDPSFVVSHYANLETTNRWPFVGNLGLATLQAVLDGAPDAQYLILSDRQVTHLMRLEAMPKSVGNWRIEPWQSFRLEADEDDMNFVRLYHLSRIANASTRPAELPRR